MLEYWSVGFVRTHYSTTPLLHYSNSAGVIASQCFSGVYQNRFTIVVDDDIDPTRIDDVVWALSTRCDPETDIDIQRRCLVERSRSDDSSRFESPDELARHDRRLQTIRMDA